MTEPIADRRSAEAEPFYVGYLAVPLPLQRFVRRTALALFVLIVVSAILVSLSQSDPGSAVWNDAVAREFHGTIIVDPYPLLIVPSTGEPSGSPPTVYLLVEMGKRGGRPELKGLAGQSATVSGWLLQRDGRRMIELEPDENAVRPNSSAASPLPPQRRLGLVTLQGEIVDSKCYLGAMKPGEGKAHKACATLCIRGGLPPMFVAASPDGGREFYLLIDPSGAPLSSDLWPLISEPLRVNAEAELLGDLRILRLSAKHVLPD